MIRILKLGKKRVNLHKEICPDCDTHFSFNDADISTINEFWDCIACPNCGRWFQFRKNTMKANGGK